MQDQGGSQYYTAQPGLPFQNYSEVRKDEPVNMPNNLVKDQRSNVQFFPWRPILKIQICTIDAESERDMTEASVETISLV